MRSRNTSGGSPFPLDFRGPQTSIPVSPSSTNGGRTHAARRSLSLQSSATNQCSLTRRFSQRGRAPHSEPPSPEGLPLLLRTRLRRAETDRLSSFPDLPRSRLHYLASQRLEQDSAREGVRRRPPRMGRQIRRPPRPRLRRSQPPSIPLLCGLRYPCLWQRLRSPRERRVTAAHIASRR